MHALNDHEHTNVQRQPWNKGKITGQKPPLQPKHVWAIRTRLQLAGRTRKLALFNLAIDSKLRACDVVRLRIEDFSSSRPHYRTANRPTEKNGATRHIRDHRAKPNRHR